MKRTERVNISLNDWDLLRLRWCAFQRDMNTATMAAQLVTEGMDRLMKEPGMNGQEFERWVARTAGTRRPGSTAKEGE